MDNRVVARYLDGRLVKGTCHDVAVTRPICHVHTAEYGVVAVRLADLKALFFVKDLAGNPEHRDLATVRPGDPRTRGATKLEIRFKDGEVLVALAGEYSAERPFFFVVPADPMTNAIRILVNRAAVLSVTEESVTEPPEVE